MPRTVIALVEDMFFVSKIQATAKASGTIMKFPRTLDAAREAIAQERPDLVIVDLHNRRLNAADFAREIKTDERLRELPLLGFFSHVQVDLQKQAMEAGFDEIIPRSIFARDLAEILVGSKPVGLSGR